MELDPVFVRALRLLHSTSKESGMQLKAMLDESIRMKKNPGSAPSKLAVAAPQQSRESHIKDTTDSKGLNKLNVSSSYSSHYQASSMPHIDIDLEGLTDLCCIICNNLNQGNGNKLVECHTCKNLYHQECHKPVILKQEESNALFQWNCSMCSCLTKVTTPLLTTKLFYAKPSKISSNLQTMKPSRPASGRNEPSSSGVFKRTDTAKSHGSASTSVSGGKPAGMAALAATYKGSSGPSSSSGLKTSSRSGTLGSNFGHSKSSSGSSSSSSTSGTIMSADKRLQLMKKKAAQRKK